MYRSAAESHTNVKRNVELCCNQKWGRTYGNLIYPPKNALQFQLEADPKSDRGWVWVLYVNEVLHSHDRCVEFLR